MKSRGKGITEGIKERRNRLKIKEKKRKGGRAIKKIERKSSEKKKKNAW